MYPLRRARPAQGFVLLIAAWITLIGLQGSQVVGESREKIDHDPIHQQGGGDPIQMSSAQASGLLPPRAGRAKVQHAAAEVKVMRDEVTNPSIDPFAAPSSHTRRYLPRRCSEIQTQTSLLGDVLKNSTREESQELYTCSLEMLDSLNSLPAGQPGLRKERGSSPRMVVPTLTWSDARCRASTGAY